MNKYQYLLGIRFFKHSYVSFPYMPWLSPKVNLLKIKTISLFLTNESELKLINLVISAKVPYPFCYMSIYSIHLLQIKLEIL